MYTVDAAYSQARWLEKCSTLIGSGTTAWAFIWEPRGFNCHSLPDHQTECRTCRFSLPISPEFTEFQLLADGDIIIDLDISLPLTHRKL